MDYQRILRGAPATVGVTFRDQYGEPRDVTGVSIAIKRADGSIVVPNTGPAVDVETFRVTATLTPQQTAALDILSLRAIAADGGVAEATVDIVGGFLFSLAEARAQELTLVNDSDEYLRLLRDAVESEAEQWCGRAFVPRLSRLVTSLGAVADVARFIPDLISWRPFLFDDHTFQNPRELSARVFAGTGRFDEPIELFFEHGAQQIPFAFRKAAISRLKDLTTDTSAYFDARATSLSNEQGTFSLVTAGVKGAQTDSPAWNAALDSMTLRSTNAMSVPIR